MIAYLKGILISASENDLILEVQGVGYQVFIPPHLLAKLPEVGSELSLQTYLVIKETTQQLFGFLSLIEKQVFEKLTNVSGIGPKLGLNLIGYLSLEQLKQAIESKDIPLLCKVPGIGKKMAERLSLELRDVLKGFLPESSSPLSVCLKLDPHSQMIQDAMSALIRLGYHQMIAQKAVKKSLSECSQKPNLPDLITQALKYCNP